MALEELHTTVNNLTFNIFGTETDRKIGGFLFNEKVEWATSRELHGLAALTFNEQSCAGIMTIISKALEPKDNTWRTLHKAVKLLHHFVIYGAERCVDHAWDRQRKVEALRGYNSAIHGRTGTLNGGGTDFGAPVRKAAEELDELLKDSERIRDARAEERAPDALLPLGDSDDYSAPVQAKAIDLGNDDAFGVIPQGSVGARFDLQQVPGLYEGRPDRYFDNTNDPRRRTQEVEDSDYTRQALAPDLLDLDLGEAQPARVPDAQDLVKAGKEEALQRQLLEQQKQLEQLKMLMLSRAQPTGGAGTVGGMGAGMGVGFGQSAGGVGLGRPADKVMEPFGSMGLGVAGGTGMARMMPSVSMQQQGMNAGGGGGVMGFGGGGGASLGRVGEVGMHGNGNTGGGLMAGGSGGTLDNHGSGGLIPQQLSQGLWQGGRGGQMQQQQQQQQQWQGGSMGAGVGVNMGMLEWGAGGGSGMRQQGALGGLGVGGMMGMAGGQSWSQGGSVGGGGGLGQQFQQPGHGYGRPNAGGGGGGGEGSLL